MFQPLRIPERRFNYPEERPAFNSGDAHQKTPGYAHGSGALHVGCSNNGLSVTCAPKVMLYLEGWQTVLMVDDSGQGLRVLWVNQLSLPQEEADNSCMTVHPEAIALGRVTRKPDMCRSGEARGGSYR